MEAEKNSVIYMGLIPGPNKRNEICGKTMVTGTMNRGSTVYLFPTLKQISLSEIYSCSKLSVGINGVVNTLLKLFKG
jgi:hypothetical protein